MDKSNSDIRRTVRRRISTRSNLKLARRRCKYMKSFPLRKRGTGANLAICITRSRDSRSGSIHATIFDQGQRTSAQPDDSMDSGHGKDVVSDNIAFHWRGGVIHLAGGVPYISVSEGSHSVWGAVSLKKSRRSRCLDGLHSSPWSCFGCAMLGHLWRQNVFIGGTARR